MAGVAELPRNALLTEQPSGTDLRDSLSELSDALRRGTAGSKIWGELEIGARLRVLRRARLLMSERSEQFADAISSELDRSRADTLVAEVLPLLAAIRYLEREAAEVLRTRRAGVLGRPLWLGRVTSLVERVPLGRVLVIAVSNYPLLLAGVQVVQALTAGNAVIWKPGRGGSRVAGLFVEILREAGLPDGVLAVTNESVEAAQTAIDLAEDSADSGIDKIFFTGSAAAGREVLHRAAERLVPCVVELSGADAVILLPSAAIGFATRAIAFGLRLNGSATCMAPRRVLLVKSGSRRRTAVLEALWGQVQAIGSVRIPAAQARLTQELLDEARRLGATVLGGEIDGSGQFQPALVLDATIGMRVIETDLFAPVLSVIDVDGVDGVLEAQGACPLALTASIFGDEDEAWKLAKQLKVGHISINDVIVPTADPRVPFTGRKQSGFGATRGAEGLLEMTAPRVIAVRRGAGTRRYERTGAAHVGLFAGLATLLYGGAMLTRMQAAKRVIASARAVSDRTTEITVTERAGDA